MKYSIIMISIMLKEFKGWFRLHLNSRLKAIADSINKSSTIADIGSDHAYLPIYLVKNNKAKRAIATDINLGPSEISRKRIKHWGLENIIDVRIGFGLEALNPKEADTIIISGMGGLLIIDILEQGLEIANSAQRIILQPMKDSYILRKWLSKNCFYISDVDIVKEKDKYYEIIWVIPGKESESSETINYFDDKLINKESTILYEYIDSIYKKYESINIKLKNHNTPNAVKRRIECAEMMGYCEEVKSWVKQNVKK